MGQIEAIGRYGGSLRRLALRVKDGRRSALLRAAALMAGRVPTGAVVVPMPSHLGRAAATLAVAEGIWRIRPDVSVCDALEAAPHGGRYAAKKAGRTPEAVRMRLRQSVPHGRRVFVIDNCVDTGATFRAASAALPDASLLVLATTGNSKSNRKENGMGIRLHFANRYQVRYADTAAFSLCLDYEAIKEVLAAHDCTVYHEEQGEDYWEFSVPRHQIRKLVVDLGATTAREECNIPVDDLRAFFKQALIEADGDCPEIHFAWF